MFCAFRTFKLSKEVHHCLLSWRDGGFPSTSRHPILSCPTPRDRPAGRVREVILKFQYHDEGMFHSTNLLPHMLVRSLKSRCRSFEEFVGLVFEILATMC